MTTTRTCDICKKHGGPENKVISFGLTFRAPVKTSDGRSQTQARSVGGIDLCQLCWEASGLTRMRPRRNSKWANGGPL
jgi:hypothetical protein